MLGYYLIFFVIFVLPPLFVAAPVWTVLALIGWPRKRLLVAAPVILLLSFGGEAWFIHWLRTPYTPDLTREQATEILRSRPEFTSQGHSPLFREVRRSEAGSAGNYLYSGKFSFVTNTGERVSDADAQFQFSDGHWTFSSCDWGPAIERTYMSIGSTEPKIMGRTDARKNIESPFLPGVCWKRLADGTYQRQKPGSDACETSLRGQHYRHIRDR